MEPAGARLCVQTALESRKIWALQVVRTVQLVGKLAFGGAARRAQNGLAELPDAMSDCLRQFGCLKQSVLRCFQHTSAIVRPAWLQTSIWSTRSVVLAKRMWLQNDGLRRGIYDAGTRTVVCQSIVTRKHHGIALDGVDSPRDAAHRGARVASPGRLGRLCDATESQNRGG